jgi:glycerophosphoryl diester phosphodiesterase
MKKAPSLTQAGQIVPISNEVRDNKSFRLRLPKNFTITAHAGAMGFPANTLAALRKAISAGADAVEMDVTFRPDSTPVIIHSEAPGMKEGVLLDKAFALFAENDSVKVNLDVKSLKNLAAVQELVTKHGLIERSFFTGVSENWVEIVKKECPLIPYYLNSPTDPSLRDNWEYAETFAKKILTLGCIGLNCQYSQISKTLVEVLHEKALLVSVWTLSRTRDINKMLSISVDNITTKKLIKLLKTVEGCSRNNT